MLLGFYSGLIVFVLLFFIVLFVWIKTFKLKKQNKMPIIMLGVLMVFTLVVASIYTTDFFYLKTEQTKSTAGACTLEFVSGGGNSLDTTEVIIDNKKYSIKSEHFKDIADGNYFCEITYLPVTKIVTEISIKN
ncbi:cobalamin biosynthesis protein CobN [Solibacillus daqui]|uniref:cobalamin biosynthesis protein CobN n=1 Tax=Solibacillus daqui TaxID=2912187 RepID=UPI0023653383|nr:cobalamin biosynthesis protein CobN [Solibacillus daqui]